MKLKALPLLMLSTVMSMGTHALANENDAVINKVKQTHQNKSESAKANSPGSSSGAAATSKNMQQQFAELKAQWQKQQKQLQARNQQLQQKLQKLESRVNALKQQKGAKTAGTGTAQNQSGGAAQSRQSGNIAQAEITTSPSQSKGGNQASSATGPGNTQSLDKAKMHIENTSPGQADLSIFDQKRLGLRQDLTMELFNEMHQHRSSSVVNRGSNMGQVYDDSFFGTSTTFEAFPSSQVPYSLLKAKNKFGKQAIVFGGYLEFDNSFFWGSRLGPDQKDVATGKYQRGWNMNVTTANLDVMVNINDWIQTYWTLSARDLGTPFLQNGFVTFGNLDKSPFFLTVGKNRVPLGVWAGGGAWLSGITQGYFRPAHNTNVMLGYAEGGLNTNIAVIDAQQAREDSSFTGDRVAFMYSIFYNGSIPDTAFTYGVDFGWMYNSSHTGMGANAVFNPASVTDPDASVVTQADGRNGVLNVEGNIGWNDFALFAGWSQFTHDKRYTNDKKGGAYYLQGTFSPLIYDQVTVFGLSYGQSYNMNGAFFPLGGLSGFGVSVKGVQNEAVAFVQRPILTPNVLVGLEYGYLELYNTDSTSEITLDLSVYF